MKKCGFVALAGRPNAGKSTFLNEILKEKISIVSDKPQTTRSRNLGIYHAENVQIGFLDLPGIHKPKYKMNRMMMRTVNQGLDEADLVLHFIDISAPLGSGDRFVHEFIAQKDVPVIIVLNKFDLVNRAKSIPIIDRFYKELQPKEIVPISSLNGENIDNLMSVISGYLPEGEPIFKDDEITNQPLRFMAQEFIREKLLHQTRDEIPHAIAVTVASWEETDDHCHIEAYIYVEKDTQRRIILGANGQLIKKVRHGARRSLKKLLEKPVDLDLFIRVKEKWRDTDNVSTEMGVSFD